MPARVSEPKTKSLSITKSIHSSIEQMNHKIDIPFQKCKARKIHAGIVHSRLKSSVSRSDSRNPPCLFGRRISSPQILMAFQVYYKITDSKNQPTNVGVKAKNPRKTGDSFVKFLVFCSAVANFVLAEKLLEEIDDFEEERLYTACVAVAVAVISRIISTNCTL